MNILLKMRICQTGLSVMVANGLLPESFNEEQTIRILDNTTEGLIQAAQMRKANSP